MKRIILLLTILFALRSAAQQDSALVHPPSVYRQGVEYIFVSKSGEKYTGVVIEENPEFVTIVNRETKERTDLRKTEIARFSRVADESLRDLQFGENPHHRDYLISTSAFLFKPGQLSSNGHWFLVDQMDYAFTENCAISLHTLVFYPMALGLKLAFPLGENNYIGGSVSGMVNLTSGPSKGTVFMGYLGSLRFTHGTENRNVTFSAGLLGLNSLLLYDFPTEPYTNTPFTSVAFCNRFAKRTAFNFEGWYLPNDDIAMAGIGIKFLESETNCWNFGCYTFLQRTNINLQINYKALPIPYIGVSRKFN